MATKATAPAIRFAGFTTPWELRKFDNLYIRAREKNDLSYGKDRIISVANMYFKTNNYITDDEYLKTYNVFKLGDIAFEGNKSKHFAHGRFVENTIGDGIVSHVFDVFRPKTTYDLLFWKHLINNESIMSDLLVRCTKSSTMMTNLVADDFLKESLLVPQVEEQRLIGKYLSQLDELIALQRRKLVKLQNVKKAMLQKMFPARGSTTPQIRFAGFTEPWQERKLGDLAAKTYGGGTPATTNEKYWGGDIPWIQSSDLTENKLSGVVPRKYITNAGLRASATRLVPKNSIAIITRVGVGKLSIMPFAYTTSQDFLSLSNLKADAQFSAYAVYNRLQSELHAVQGTSIKGITKEELLAKELLLPEPAEQIKIGAYFKHLDIRISLQQRKLEKLQNVKKACLAAMFV